jgi:hypothetical protein
MNIIKKTDVLFMLFGPNEVLKTAKSHNLETLKTKRDETYKRDQRLKPHTHNRLKFLYGVNASIKHTFCKWRKQCNTIPTTVFLRVVMFQVYIPLY